jgi:hypothetical protein
MIFNEEIWRKLESESPVGEKITARLALPEVSKKLYVGFDSNKLRHLLVSLEENDEEYHDLQSRGFSIITRDLVVKGSAAKRYIDITCHDNSGHIIFDVIGGEIAEKLDKSKNAKEMIGNVINKWRNFWGKSLRELLSSNEIIGLFAELWFLGYWLLPKVDKLEAIKRWRGPFASRHDFEWTGKSIEVKATINVHGRTHKINGIDQLSPPENGELFLFSLRLREEQGAENTLPGIIAFCREKLKEDIDALSKFENILVVAGYSPLFDEEYSKLKFRIVDEKLYKVTDEFPKIVSDSFTNGLPSGVSMIEYVINLDGYNNLCIASSPSEIANVLD